MIHEQIEARLRAVFHPQHIEITDESHRHNVPEGSESHFKIVIVSESFTTQRLIQRHRAIYSELAELIVGHIHALALHPYTGKEWAERQGCVTDSPNCRGAGIHA